MAIKRLTCPHCEQSVEIQVSSVTRSRECPLCGNPLFLQVAEKEHRVKRRALLMETEEVKGGTESGQAGWTPGAPPAPTTPPPSKRLKAAPPVKVGGDELPYVPQSLEGDALERMKSDPELVRHRKYLILGAVLVLIGSGLLIAINLYLSEAREAAEREVAGRLGLLEEEAREGRNLPVRKVEETAPTEVEPDASKGLQLGGVEDNQPPATEDPSVDVKNPTAVLAEFLKAPSWRERRLWTAAAAQQDSRAKVYYETHKDGPIAFRKVSDPKSEGVGVTGFDVTLEDYQVRRAHVILHENRYWVDWSSFVLYNEMTFAELRGKKPTRPVMARVLVKAGNHYKGMFEDANWVLCLELRQADDPSVSPLYAYVQRNSALGGEMNYWLQTLPPEGYLEWTVGLRYPPDADSDDEVWLDTILGKSWFTMVVTQRK